jgi:ribonuclease HI
MAVEKQRPVVHLFTDGACSPNPGIGGWAAILVSPKHGGHSREITGGEADSTNQRMELRAAIGGLAALKEPCAVVLSTDSQYVLRGFTKGWVENWKRNGWRTSARKPVVNEELWRELDRLCGIHEVEWKWVRGHAGHPENTRADALAVDARRRLAQQLRGRAG